MVDFGSLSQIVGCSDMNRMTCTIKIMKLIRLLLSCCLLSVIHRRVYLHFCLVVHMHCQGNFPISEMFRPMGRRGGNKQFNEFGFLFKMLP